MAQHAELSGTTALSRLPRNVSRGLPRGVSAPGVLPHHPTPPAEIAQARVFERLLQAEGIELRELAHGLADDQDSGELTQINARIDEVDNLLRALRGRFPHSAAK